MGLSLLVPKEEDALEVTVSWGDYGPVQFEDDDGRTCRSGNGPPHLEKAPIARSEDPVSAMSRSRAAA